MPQFDTRNRDRTFRHRRVRWALALLVLGVAAHWPSPARADEADTTVFVLEAERMDRPPTIDGRLDEWTRVPRDALAVLGRSEQVLPARRAYWKGPADLSAVVQVAVHDDDLFLAATVTDDRRFHDPAEPWWHGDSLEVFLNFDYEPGTEVADAYTDGCWQIFLMPFNPELAWGVVSRRKHIEFDDGGLRGVEMAHTRTQGGSYDMEVRIPLANFGVTSREERRIGFSLAINDADDGPSEPGTYMTWNERADLWLYPNRFGVLVLPYGEPDSTTVGASEGSRALWWLFAGVIALGAALLLAGPGARALSQWGPKPKWIGLGLIGLLAGGVHLQSSLSIEDARSEVLAELEALADRAGPIVTEAQAVGALLEPSIEDRSAMLAQLLRGEAVPCRPGIDGVAFVPLHENGAYSDDREKRYRIALDEERVFHLPEPTRFRALSLDVDIETVERGRPASSFLGRLTLESDDGTAVTRDVAAVAPATVRVDEERAWSRLRWTPAAGAPFSVLRRVTLDDAGTALPLSGRTEDGIPVLAHPGGPDHGRNLAPEESMTVPIPALLGGGDRLWVVMTASRAFPDLLGDSELARIDVVYDVGEAEQQSLVLRNGEHLAAERLPAGLERPSTMTSRVAYRWQDNQGYGHTHDAIPIRLRTERRPLSVTITNLGPGGTVRVLAASVVRTRRPAPRSSIGVVTDESRRADEAHLVEGGEAFASRLSTDAPDPVVLDRTIAGSPPPVTLRLRAPLPSRVADKRERTKIALLTCLAIALFLLVLLAVDAAEHFPMLSRRLSFGVLAAALVPLAVTILLVERGNAKRVEAEHTERARNGLTSAAARMDDVLRNAQSASRRLARHLSTAHREGQRIDIAGVVGLYGDPALPAGTGGSALVAGADLVPTPIPLGPAGEGLKGTRFLPVSSEPGGFHVSPWDGLLMLGTARSGSGDDWMRVTLAVRTTDRYLRTLLDDVVALPGASLVILDAQGRPLARAGDHARDLVRALADNTDEVRARLDQDATAQLLRLSSGPREHLAVVTRLSPVGGRPNDAAWLALSLDRAVVEAAVAEQRDPLIWLGLFGLVLVACVASLMARRVAKPVRDLVKVTEAVRTGLFDVDVPPAGADEVGDLTVAFDQMRLDLKHRVADLDFLRAAQDRFARSLDFGALSDAVLELFHDHFQPTSSVLLDVPGAGATMTVLAERGRKHAFSDRPIHPAEDGWLAAAVRSDAPTEVTSAASDETVAREATIVRRLTEERNAWLSVPLRSGAELQALVVLAWSDASHLPRGEARRLLEPLAGIAASALNNARLYRLAALDDVTRLPGATAFEAALRSDVERSLAGGRPTVLLRVGLDHVEHVTLRRGVELSRELLRVCADALRSVVGDRSRLGRLRGEELAVRLSDVGAEEARAVAEQIRERLGAVEITPEEGGDAVGTSVSVGIARAPDDARSVEFLLDAAGRALTAAKREGGNHVQDVARVDASAVETPPFEEGAVFRNERMVRVVDAARRAAQTDASVLITGETGTGKEVIANLIHRRSNRANRPFVTVNCAAFPETLLESELFGHERGAFTGADRRREGRFELADGGTLFLDEVAEMTPSAQVKLLRVLQEHQFTRLGGTRTVTVDVRIIAATNRDLEQAVSEGHLREDLYYRLNVIRLELPPLRSRREEIPHLVEKFLRDFRRRSGRGPIALTPAAMDVLYRHPWPGNVRELKNAVERCAVLCEADHVGPEHLQLDGTVVEGATLAPRGAPQDELNPRQRKLLDYLARNGRCTNREYTEMTGTSPRTALRDLHDLMDRGLLVRDGKRRGAVYRLP